MNADSKAGLTAREALEVLTPDPQDDPEQPTMLKSDLELWSGGTSWVDAEYDERLGEALRPIIPLDPRPLLEPLANGEWYAKGFRSPIEPSSHPEQIPAHLWAVLNLDFDRNAASAGGLEYKGLECFEGRSDHPVSMAPAEKKCRLWLTEKFKAPKSEKKLNCQAAAKDQFEGLSNRGFLRAWTEAMAESTTHTSWHKPGPINSS